MSLISFINAHLPISRPSGLPPHFNEAVKNLRQQNDVPVLGQQQLAMRGAIFNLLADKYPEQRPLQNVPNAAAHPIHTQNLTGAYYEHGKGPGGIRNLSRCAPQPDGTHVFATSVLFDTLPNKATIVRAAAGIVDHAVRTGSVPPHQSSSLFEALQKDLKQMMSESDKQRSREKISVTASYVLVPGVRNGNTTCEPTIVLQTASLSSPGKPTISRVGVDVETNLQAYREFRAKVPPQQWLSDPDVLPRLLLAQHDPAANPRLQGPALPLKKLVDDFIEFARSASSKPSAHRKANAFEAYHLGRNPAADPALCEFITRASKYWRPTSDKASNATRFSLVMAAYAAYETRIAVANAPLLAEQPVGRSERLTQARPSTSSSYSTTSSDSTWVDHAPRPHRDEEIEEVSSPRRARPDSLAQIDSDDEPDTFTTRL